MLASYVSSDNIVAYPCHKEELSCTLDNLYELSSFDDTQKDLIF